MGKTSNLGGERIGGGCGSRPQFDGGFANGLRKSGFEVILRRGEKLLGTDEAGEAEGGQTEGAEKVEGFREGLSTSTQFDDAADGDTHDSNLFSETVKAAGFEVFDIGEGHSAGIEAVLKGVFVATGCASAARGDGDSFGHGGLLGME
jgi:hypothetical protein